MGKNFRTSRRLKKNNGRRGLLTLTWRTDLNEWWLISAGAWSGPLTWLSGGWWELWTGRGSDPWTLSTDLVEWWLVRAMDRAGTCSSTMLKIWTSWMLKVHFSANLKAVKKKNAEDQWLHRESRQGRIDSKGGVPLIIFSGRRIWRKNNIYIFFKILSKNL